MYALWPADFYAISQRPHSMPFRSRTHMHIVKEVLYNYTCAFTVHMELELWELLLPGDPFPNPIVFKYAYSKLAGVRLPQSDPS